MKKITNPGLLKRNKLIGKYATLASFIVLAGGIAISNFLQDRFDLSYLALILGSILVLVGSTFTSRWGRIPPPDQAVDDVLKGLDERYTIVHYRLGAEHALFTPDGILAILAKNERGRISYDGKKWRQTGVSKLAKFFGTESLGNPSSDSLFEAESLTRALRKLLEDGGNLIVRPIVIFVNDKTRVEADSSPVPALHASKVKEYIRHMPKSAPLRPDQLRRVIEYAGGKK
ncbi:MAG: NERD domain-containing protein [Anaerolineales bacterium]|nr:NERD domain-containing protein [Anaerolineales bacterium]